MKIGNFDLQKDGTFIIAELSANHNGSLEVAKQTIKAAKEIGANAIKLQTYRADTITLNSKNPDFMIEGGTLWDGKNLYELYQEAYTPWEWHKELFDYARSLNIDIFSSPFDKSAVDFLETLNPTAYKIASFNRAGYSLVHFKSTISSFPSFLQIFTTSIISSSVPIPVLIIIGFFLLAIYLISS